MNVNKIYNIKKHKLSNNMKICEYKKAELEEK